MTMDVSRREFIKTVGAAAALSHSVSAAQSGENSMHQETAPTPATQALDLTPAQWIWYPSQRTLPNTFLLFRRSIHLTAPVKQARGWIAVDSRYKLYVNGRYVQFGPAPSDPRWLEADPMDLSGLLKSGENVIGVQALYYGFGDGVWPIGKPGLIIYLEIEEQNGGKQLIVSDEAWRVLLTRAWRPGQYKRWYLRSLQEEFDARAYPYGWQEPGYSMNELWVAAMTLQGRPDQPALTTLYKEYMLDVSGARCKEAQLRKRSIPLMREEKVAVQRLSEQYRLEWQSPVEDYFEFITPEAFRVSGQPQVRETEKGRWQVRCDGKSGIAMTFEFSEQVVGWPCLALQAPAGTVVELLVHEAHEPGGPVLINSHFNSWTRFICKEGINHFETFDFESLRWLQLHIHGVEGTVEIFDLHIRRRIYPWPHQAAVRCSEAPLQKLFDATVNTLNNSCQETMVDGMARERQQYSGDCGHQLHAVEWTFGETALPARFLTTYSQGITLDGYFLDSWPAYDRLARLMERQLHLTGWGPILDHGIGFNFDCYYHYLYTGDLSALHEPFPRLLRFFHYLKSIRTPEGLLPVENLGIPSVWIDHIAYQKQQHKQCAFNLYAAAMLQHALKPLCVAMGDLTAAAAVEQFGREILQSAVRAFWSRRHGLFVNNLPWLDEEKGIRTCDRSLATAVLFDQCPFGAIKASVASLVECPEEMGFSYPANAGWRLWALAKVGRTDVIVKDLRERWAVMDSVLLNNTLQEDWEVKPDSDSQWSHCPVVPLYVLYMNLAGIQPLEPGCRRVRIWPQPAGLEEFELTAHTVLGPIHFHTFGRWGNRSVTVRVPAAMQAEIWLDRREKTALKRIGSGENGCLAYELPAGQEISFKLKYTP